MFFSDGRLIRQFYWVMVIADHRVLCTHIPSFVYICTYIHTYVHTIACKVVCVCGKLHTVVKGHFAISHLGCLLTIVCSVY